MSGVQIIEKNGEPEFAVIPIDEFERMRAALEDAEDIADIERFRARLARGEEEEIPAGMVDRLLAGESALKVWLEYRKIEPKDLCEAARISKGYLSQLESGGRKGTIDVWRRLAQVLNVSLDDIAPEG